MDEAAAAAAAGDASSSAPTHALSEAEVQRLLALEEVPELTPEQLAAIDLAAQKGKEDPASYLQLRIQHGLPYRAALDLVIENYAAEGLTLSSKTHVFGGGSARTAQDAGASDSQIQKLGKWHTGSAMQNYYLTSFIGIRAVAGHASEPAGRYYVARAEVEPPAELIDAVFPELNKWVEDADGKWPSNALPHVSRFQDSMDFIRLLAYLRVVILQDMALVQASNPHHFLLAEPIFQTKLFSDFATKVQQHCANAHTQSNPLVASALSALGPELAAELRTTNAKLHHLETENAALRKDVEATRVALRETRQALQKNHHDTREQYQRIVTQGAVGQQTTHEGFAQMRLRFEREALHKEMQALMSAAASHVVDGNVLEIDVVSICRNYREKMSALDEEEGRSRMASSSLFAHASTSAAAAAALPTTLTREPEQTAAAAAATQASPSSTSATPMASPVVQPLAAATPPNNTFAVIPTTPDAIIVARTTPMPVYIMEDKLTTAEALVREWYINHGPHDTCTAYMEAVWGTAWRNPRMSKNFSRFSYVIREVQRLAAINAAPSASSFDSDALLAASKQMDAEIFRTESSLSLKQLKLAKLWPTNKGRKRKSVDEDGEGETP